MRRPILLLLAVFGLITGALAVPATADSGPTCAGRRATIVGTGGNDRLQGTPRADVIVGFGGHDHITGGGGHDLICGSGGSDRIYGGYGHDRLFGGYGDDNVHGDAGNDRVYGGPGDDSMSGGRGDDRLNGGDGDDGGSGESGADVLIGGNGDDAALDGGWGPDRVYGGPGVDHVRGGRGRDYVHGGAGRDKTIFWAYDDHGDRGVRLDLASGELVTVDGRETLTSVQEVEGTPYDDVLLGSRAYEELSGRTGDDRVVGRGGNDRLQGVEVLGGAGDDWLHTERGRAVGHSGNDVIWARVLAPGDGYPLEATQSPISGYGGPGNDSFLVIDHCTRADQCEDRGEVRFAGGDGADRVRVSLSRDVFGNPRSDSYRMDLAAGLLTNSYNDLVVHANAFTQAIGTVNDDTIIGTNGANLLMGDDGNDTITGGGGDDVLAGGIRAYDDGSDDLDAGAGTDTCYTSTPTPPDTTTSCETHRQVPNTR